MVESAVPADVIELYRDPRSYNSAFNHDASDKMKLLGLGELPPPAQCFVCGSGTCEAGYVTFGVWADGVGNLLVCSPCLVQASELVGCLAPVPTEIMHKHVAQLQDYSKDLETQLAGQDEQLAAYRTISDSFLDRSASGGYVTSDPGPTPINNDVGESVTVESAESAELTEPSDEQRPDDLRSITEGDSDDLNKPAGLITL